MTLQKTKAEVQQLTKVQCNRTALKSAVHVHASTLRNTMFESQRFDKQRHRRVRLAELHPGVCLLDHLLCALVSS